MKSKLGQSTGGKIQGGAFYIGSYQNVYCVVCKEQAVKHYSCPNGCAAEELGVAALQSGEAPSQQLKPKMPSFKEVHDEWYTWWKREVTTDAPNEHSMKVFYEIIARHFGH